MNNIRLYEQMNTLSAQMAEAAVANNWERLSALEREVASLRDRLKMEDPVSRAPVHLSEVERRTKADLIKRILANDREVRRHTEPWMESVRHLLGGNARNRAVRAAYSAVAE